MDTEWDLTMAEIAPVQSGGGPGTEFPSHKDVKGTEPFNTRLCTVQEFEKVRPRVYRRTGRFF